MELICFFVSFLSSAVGAICGIGGGVVIKPVLDFVQMGSAGMINFLSGCTVLSMSLYSVGKALGATLGGVAGKKLFAMVNAFFPNGAMVGGVQAAILALITVGTLLYTVAKSKITTRQFRAKVFCVAVGVLLGIISSFLGIGGGPINLVVLGYCFSMDSKTAAVISLYIILFSQLASLLAALISGVPGFPPMALALMVAGGIGGGIAGRALNRKMDNQAVDTSSSLS